MAQPPKYLTSHATVGGDGSAEPEHAAIKAATLTSIAHLTRLDLM